MIFFCTSDGEKIIPSNKKSFGEFLMANKGKRLVMDLKRENYQRTTPQNNSLHLFYSHLSRELNDAGYTVQIVLKEKIDLDWNERLVKELLWRPAQQAILGINSTTELKKIEDIDLVYEHLNRHIGQKFGIHVPFPDRTLLPQVNMPEYPQENKKVTAF